MYSITTEEEYEKLIQYLFSFQDEKYKIFHQRLVPEVKNLKGIRVPVIKNTAKKIAKENWQDFTRFSKSNYYEEDMLLGLVIGNAKISDDERIKQILAFVPRINNWAVCDCFCASLKAVNFNKKLYWDFLMSYRNSESEFELRFLVVMLMDYYIDELYIDNLLEIFNNIRHSGYYVKMAIAWAVSFCFIKYETKTMIFLKNNSLDDFTYNKAIQKIIESYRVSNDIKDILKKQKRRIIK